MVFNKKTRLLFQEKSIKIVMTFSFSMNRSAKNIAWRAFLRNI